MPILIPSSTPRLTAHRAAGVLSFRPLGGTVLALAGGALALLLTGAATNILPN